MARILAVDWDRREARYVLATTSAQKLRIRAAEVVPLADVPANAGDSRPELGELLRDSLTEHGVGRAVTLVGVDRASVELMHLTLPPAEDDELPQMVANQAIRESQTVTEDSALDFVATSDDPAEPREVVAAALSSEQLERINAICATAGLKPSRILLRPYASASLFSRTASPPEDVCLLVNLVADEADLTVLVQGKAVFSRTVRLPGIDDEQKLTERLVSEIKRTLAVSLESRPGRSPVQRVYIFGGPDDHQLLVNQIGRQLSLSAMVLEPFVAVDVRQGLVPENSGRFASLLGMLLDEARGGRHAIDFLHPRRPPPPPNRRRPLIIAAALLLLAILSGAYCVWDQLAEADTHNRELAEHAKELERSAKQARKKKELVEVIGNWEAGNVNWLDELRDLSLRFPSSRDVVVLRMTMAPARAGGGTIDLQLRVREPSIVTRMEDSIRDKHHEVSSKGFKERMHEKDYTWGFDTSMFVSKRDKSGYVSHLPEQPSKAQEAAKADTRPAKAGQDTSQGKNVKQVDRS